MTGKKVAIIYSTCGSLLSLAPLIALDYFGLFSVTNVVIVMILYFVFYYYFTLVFNEVTGDRWKLSENSAHFIKSAGWKGMLLLALIGALIGAIIGNLVSS